jgi:hypothetical protein
LPCPNGSRRQRIGCPPGALKNKGPRNGPGPRGAENLNRFRERLDHHGHVTGRATASVPVAFLARAVGRPVWPSSVRTVRVVTS